MSDAHGVDVVMGDSGETSIQHEPAAAMSSSASSVKPAPTVEEDVSSLSSSGTNLLDQSSVEPNINGGKWGYAAVGTWRRSPA